MYWFCTWGGVARVQQKGRLPRPVAIQKGTRVLISLWDSRMFGRVPSTRPNISESHSEIRTRVPFAPDEDAGWHASRARCSCRVAVPAGRCHGSLTAAMAWSCMCFPLGPKRKAICLETINV